MAYISINKKNPKSKILNPKKTRNVKFKRKSFADKLILTGFCFLFIGSLVFLLTFYPVIKEELRYLFAVKTSQINPKKDQIEPMSKDFGIVIPKIQANAKIVANVDPYNSKEYQWQLTKGIAQAKGSSLPGQIGNIFLFAHSSDNWYNANRYNAVFYLINKLKKGDEIDIYFKNKKYRYTVDETKLVNADQIKYLTIKPSSHLLTLMTCWPPGTTLKRLVVIAKYVSSGR